MQRTPVIAIDGPAASGKGTISRFVAAAMGYDVLDTGLLYRAVAKSVMDSGADPHDPVACGKAALSIDPSAVDGVTLRGEGIAHAASVCSAHPSVREALLEIQRSFATSPPGGMGAVLDGRDIGTVVCPDATVKLWITASPEVRAKRRCNESQDGPSESEIADMIRARDEREASRAASPMRPAPDAIVIDTSELSPAQAFSSVMRVVAGVLSEKSPESLERICRKASAP